MMPSAPIHHRSDTLLHCWFSPGSAHAHVEQLEWPAIVPAILPRKGYPARSPLRVHSRFEAKTAAQPSRCNFLKLYPAAKSP